MFNKKQYKLNKKYFYLFKIKNTYKIKLINFILNKNNKNNILIKTIFNNNYKNLYKGNRNICSITGKYKSIFNSLKISRHIIRDFGGTSKLPNYSKLSW